MKRILANAQFFGFAPSSLLLATLEELTLTYPNQFLIDIVSNEHIRALCASRKNMPYNLVDLNDVPLLDYLLESNACRTYDAFLSYYDPTLMLYAWFFDKPRILYDGLFHFWDEQSFRHTLMQDIAQVEEYKRTLDVGKLREWHNALWIKNPHEMLFAGHIFADVQFARKAPDLDHRLSEYPQLKKKIIPVGCIIHAPTHSLLPEVARDMILVSLGGSLNPIVTFEQNIFYAKMVIKFIKEMLPQLSPRPATCCVVVHPLIHQRLQTDLPDYAEIDIVSSVDQDTYFSWLQKSIVAFVPPSYTTLQECAYFETPVFLLPEQNGGQPHCFTLLSKSGYTTEYSMTVSGQLGTTYGEFEVQELYADIGRLYDQNKQRTEILTQICNFYTLAAESESRSILNSRQKSVICHMMGDFNGAADIANTIHSYLFSHHE